jgi:hypothetical protein
MRVRVLARAQTSEGLARWFRQLTGDDMRAHDEACRQVLTLLKTWVPAFVAQKLRFLRHHLEFSEAMDLSGDAIQHVAIRAIQGRTTRLARTDDIFAEAWCKRVISNFLRDEARAFRKRERLPLLAPTPSEQEDSVRLRSDVQLLLSVLGDKIVNISPPRYRTARRALFDEFLAGAFSGQAGAEGGAATALKRRRRGRLLALNAWTQVRSEYGDLEDVAVALGLVDERREERRGEVSAKTCAAR